MFDGYGITVTMRSEMTGITNCNSSIEKPSGFWAHGGQNRVSYGSVSVYFKTNYYFAGCCETIALIILNYTGKEAKHMRDKKKKIVKTNKTPSYKSPLRMR